jgi:RNA polymerase sigma-70 factor (ECF subfamily)
MTQAETPAFSEDLALARACAAGDAAAIARLEAECIEPARAALGSFHLGPEFADEVLQLLRTKLLVADPTKPAKIGSYAGRGPLAAWVRAAAMRTALNHRESAQPGRWTSDAEPFAQLASGDPELAFIKGRYRGEFQAALDEALQQLTPRERNTLRHHLVQGLSFHAIGKLYGISHTTVSRQLAAYRQKVLTHLRERISPRLSLDPREFESLLRLIESQLGASLRFLLRAP